MGKSLTHNGSQWWLKKIVQITNITCLRTAHVASPQYPENSSLSSNSDIDTTVVAQPSTAASQTGVVFMLAFAGVTGTYRTCVNVAVSRQTGHTLRCHHMRCLSSSVFCLHLNIGHGRLLMYRHWAEFFPTVKLRNGDVD